MPQRPSQDEQDEYEAFARAALGKQDPKKKPGPHVSPYAERRDTVRLKKDMEEDEKKSVRGSFPSANPNVPFGAPRLMTKEGSDAYQRLLAREDSLRSVRRKNP